MTDPPQTFDTPRLQLRKPLVRDAEVIFQQYAQDSEVTRYVSWRSHATVEETRQFLRSCLDAWKESKSFHWVIVRKGDQQLAGMISARVENHRWELGYVLARPFWGHGYMTEVVKEIIEWAFRQPEIYRVWAVCDIDNVASARVMEKSGMSREGTLQRWSVHPNVSAEPRDSFCYAIIK
ncbi:MAG TPA: GNAT family N-acetyltransferase [Candidatus Binatia bacterium]